MENFYSIHNFEGAGRPINSPRSLEACLRLGIDPSELEPRTQEELVEGKTMRPDFAKRLYETFERKRKGMIIFCFSVTNFQNVTHLNTLLTTDKISWVMQERESIIQFRNRKSGTQSAPAASSSSGADADAEQENKKSAMLEIVSISADKIITLRW